MLDGFQIARSLDLSKYDGVVTISGDGLLNEIITGLLRREDWQEARNMPVGIIPAGAIF